MYYGSAFSSSAAEVQIFLISTPLPVVCTNGLKALGAGFKSA